MWLKAPEKPSKKNYFFKLPRRSIFIPINAVNYFSYCAHMVHKVVFNEISKNKLIGKPWGREDYVVLMLYVPFMMGTWGPQAIHNAQKSNQGPTINVLLLGP